MRFAVVIAAILVQAGAALGFDLGNQAPPKPDIASAEYVSGSERQGGDVIETAFPIASLPFNDTGTTTGFTNDYDFACPYTGSTAPDVVYVFESTVEIDVVIDLCGSQYDTKVYVVDVQSDLLACNDDAYFGPPCGEYVSRTVASLPASQPVFIVVDGYGGENGPYTLTVSELVPCVIEQPDWAWLENEPPLNDDYLDATNGGCNSPEFGEPMSTLALWFGSLTYGFYGTSGWYQYEGATRRDTDWIRVQHILYFPTLTLEIESEQPVTVCEMSPQNCDDFAVVNSVDVAPCEKALLTISTFEGGYPQEIWIWVGPSTMGPSDGGAMEFNYSIKVLEYEDDPQPVGPEADYSLGCPFLPAGEHNFWNNDLSPFTNQFDPSFNECGAPVTTGRDMVFEFYLAQGDQMSARIRHDWLPSASRPDPLYPVCVVDNCRLGPETYVSGAIHLTGWTGVSFSAPATGYYYLVWDGEGSGGVGDHMHIDIDASVEPPPPPPHNDCAGAPTIAPGAFDFVDDLTAARNTFDPGRVGCAGRGGTGRDVVYRVAMADGWTLEATMSGTGEWNEELYLISDCADPMHSCVAGGEPDADGGAHLTWIADAPGVYWLVCDSYGNGPRAFTLTGTLATEVTAILPAADGVMGLSCAPNPFNPRTTVSFRLPAAGHATVAIYDARGMEVVRVVDETRPAGLHSVDWDGRDSCGASVPSGTYFCRLMTPWGTESRKMNLVR